MAPFAAQPSQEHPHQHACVKPIRLGSFVLARDRDAARMDDVGLDPMPSQPPCQPKSVSSGFESNSDACDGMTLPNCFVTPAMQHAQQFRFVRHDLLQWLAFDSWNGPRNQPTLFTELYDNDQGDSLLERDELRAS
jgi:hypothetical protein